MKSTTEKTVKGLSSQTIVVLSRGVLELVVFSLMSRLLTKDEFGCFAILTVVLTIFKAFSEAGIGASIIQSKSIDKTYIGTATILNLALSAILMTIGVLFANPITNFLGNRAALKIPFIIIVLTIPLYGLNSILRALMIKELHFMKYGMMQLISYVVAAIIGVILAYCDIGLYSLIVMNAVEIIILNIILIISTKFKFLFVWSSEKAKSIFSYGGWLTIENLFRNLYHQLDSLVLTQIVSTATIGAFNRPRSFLNSISTNVNSIFDVTLFPILSDINDDLSKIQSAFNKTISLLNIFSGLFAVLLFFNAHLIIEIFFGNQWVDLIPIFKILCIDFLLKADGRLVDCFYRSLGYVKVNFYMRVIACVLLTISIIIGNIWGLVGIALSVVICNGFVILLKISYLTKLIKLNLIHTFFKILNSYRFALIIASISIIFYLFFNENEILYNILYLVFIVVVIVLFALFMPGILGKVYKQTVYSIFLRKVSAIKNRLRI